MSQIKHSIIKLLEALLISIIAILVLDVLWGVLSRYLLGAQSSWTEELARVLLVWVVLLGSALAYHSKEHLGLDYFVQKMDPKIQRKNRILTDIIVLAFALLVPVWGGINMVSETFKLGQMLMALNIPKGFVYLAVPISGAFFAFFAIDSLANNLRRGNPSID